MDLAEEDPLSPSPFMKEPTGSGDLCRAGFVSVCKLGATDPLDRKTCCKVLLGTLQDVLQHSWPQPQHSISNHLEF